MVENLWNLPVQHGAAAEGDEPAELPVDEQHDEAPVETRNTAAENFCPRHLPTRELLHFPVENATINWYIFN